MDIIDENKGRFNSSMEHLKSEVATLRTGRATPALVEDIIVDAYSIKQPLKAVASIMVTDAKTLTIDAWDKSLIPAIESAMAKSQLGFNPVNDGKVIRLPLPELTQERRQELIKLLHQKLEHARIAIRQIREEVRQDILKAEKDKEIGEDDKYGFQEELDKLVKLIKDKNLPFMAGFNRRFSPYAREIKKHILSRVNPLIINYQM
ncbi:ribosome recycling factor, partial [Patescibacteria group bacterium]|nr:ribosome recycling factor [Patescibacteria group bacterium]MBU1895265.1 ribosome recycling factor [Patescibacteria group bacterium]